MPDKIDYEWRTLWNRGSTPPIRCNTSAGVYAGSLWLICGTGAGIGRSNEVWKYTLADCSWNLIACKGDTPTKRDGQSASYVGDGKFMVFGGQGHGVPNPKSERLGDVVKSKTYLIREVHNDLYQLDCIRKTWTRVNVAGTVFPPGRRGHCAVYVGQMTPRQVSRSHHARPTDDHHSHGHLAIDHNRPKEEPKKQEGATVTDHCLLVFAGSGIEASKHTELLYNDLWMYCLDSNHWFRLFPSGPAPRPMFDMRWELVGEQLIVVGGIVGTQKAIVPRANELPSTDVFALNIRTLAWTNLDFTDMNGKAAKLNFHGHTIVSDPHDANMLFIFGGKETIDGKRASTVKKNKKGLGARMPYVWTLDLTNNTFLPLQHSSHVPEHRFGHLGISFTPVDELLSQSEHNLQVLAMDKSRASNVKKPGFQAPVINFEPVEEPIMLIFGGSYIDRGGFCDPVVFQLMRVRGVSEANALLAHHDSLSLDLNLLGPALNAAVNDSHSQPSNHSRMPSARGTMSRLGSARSQLSSSRSRLPSVHVKARSSKDLTREHSSMPGFGHGKEMMSLGSMESEADEDPEEKQNFDKQPSIWVKIQIQQNELVDGEVRDPATWNELKLALTHSLTERSSLHNSKPSTASRPNTSSRMYLENQAGRMSRTGSEVMSRGGAGGDDMRAMTAGSLLSAGGGGGEGGMNFNSSLPSLALSAAGPRQSRTAPAALSPGDPMLGDLQAQRMIHSSQDSERMLLTGGLGYDQPMPRYDEFGQEVNRSSVSAQISSSLHYINKHSKLSDKNKEHLKTKTIGKLIQPLIRGMTAVEAKEEYLRVCPLSPLKFPMQDGDFHVVNTHSLQHKIPSTGGYY